METYKTRHINKRRKATQCILLSRFEVFHLRVFIYFVRLTFPALHLSAVTSYLTDKYIIHPEKNIVILSLAQT